MAVGIISKMTKEDKSRCWSEKEYDSSSASAFTDNDDDASSSSSVSYYNVGISDKRIQETKKKQRRIENDNNNNDAVSSCASSDDDHSDSNNSTTSITKKSSGNNAGNNFTSRDYRGSSFGMSTLEAKWENMFERLFQYREKHGNCLVPNRFPDDPKLGLWVSTQRRQYKKMISGAGDVSTPMTPERAKRLSDIGFQWSTTDPRHAPWEQRFEELGNFVKKYGHSRVPMGWKENIQLANWVSTQRQEYKLRLEGRSTRLTDDRIQLLNDIGFVWEAQRGGPRKQRKANRCRETSNHKTVNYGFVEGTGNSFSLGTESNYLKPFPRRPPPSVLLGRGLGFRSSMPIAARHGRLTEKPNTSAVVASSIVAADDEEENNDHNRRLGNDNVGATIEDGFFVRDGKAKKKQKTQNVHTSARSMFHRQPMGVGAGGMMVPPFVGRQHGPSWHHVIHPDGTTVAVPNTPRSYHPQPTHFLRPRQVFFPTFTGGTSKPFPPTSLPRCHPGMPMDMTMNMMATATPRSNFMPQPRNILLPHGVMMSNVNQFGVEQENGRHQGMGALKRPRQSDSTLVANTGCLDDNSPAGRMKAIEKRNLDNGNVCKQNNSVCKDKYPQKVMPDFNTIGKHDPRATGTASTTPEYEDKDDESIFADADEDEELLFSGAK